MAIEPIVLSFGPLDQSPEEHEVFDRYLPDYVQISATHSPSGLILPLEGAVMSSERTGAPMQLTFIFEHKGKQLKIDALRTTPTINYLHYEEDGEFIPPPRLERPAVFGDFINLLCEAAVEMEEINEDYDAVEMMQLIIENVCAAYQDPT